MVGSYSPIQSMPSEVGPRAVTISWSTAHPPQKTTSNAERASPAFPRRGKGASGLIANAYGTNRSNAAREVAARGANPLQNVTVMVMVSVYTPGAGVACGATRPYTGIVWI